MDKNQKLCALIKKYFDIGDHKKFIHSYVTNEKNIDNHCFYPFIHVRIKARRYKKVNHHVDKIPSAIKAHSYLNEKGERISNIKTRKIYYAAHIDSQIYSYYALEVLGKKYEDVLKKNTELSKCICAYRKIRVESLTRNKSNIHFAGEVFDFIQKKIADVNTCSVITMDISEFFDSLDHTILYTEWAELLGVSKLPPAHFNIYRSLTNFSYINLIDLFRYKGIKHINDLYDNGINSFFSTRKELREAICKFRFLKRHPYKNSHGQRKGIPQGTAISAFLANLYLKKFDEKIFELVNSNNGLYRRYSDDIIIVCSNDVKDDFIKTTTTLISDDFKLTIHPSKTQKFLFEKNDDRIESYEIKHDGTVKANALLNYLGFEFNGKHVRIKSASLSKFYRQMIIAVKRRAFFASKEMKKNGSCYSTPRKALHLNNIYKLYSHYGKHEKKKKNFIIYAKEAYEIIGAKEIRRQLRHVWKNLNYTINRNLEKYRINEINDDNKYWKDLIQNTKNASLDSSDNIPFGIMLKNFSNQILISDYCKETCLLNLRRIFS